jgi:hypothetical protein
MSSRDRKLCMERMEARQMMAGDIAGYVSGNTLHLYESYGQAGQDNSVLISQISPGTVRVRGNWIDGDATKVNGQDHVDFQVTGKLNITFGGGNDSVYFSAIAPPAFNDVNLNLAGPTTTSTTARTTPTTVTSTPTFGTLNPPDKDTVVINGATIPGWLTINTGAGDDQVTIIDTSVGKSDLKSGAPNTGGITVNTGLGNDTIYFNDLRSSHDININAGAGNDKVDILNGAVVDNFMADLGDGDDVLSISSLRTMAQSNSDKTRILGGNGTDRITRTGTPFKNLEMTGWEYINGVRVLTPIVDTLTGGVATNLV